MPNTPAFTVGKQLMALGVKEARFISSRDALEAKQSVLTLYHKFLRAAPLIHEFYGIRVPYPVFKQRLRELFENQKHVEDIRVIDMLVYRGRLDLYEMSMGHRDDHHIMHNYFKDVSLNEPKLEKDDFMGKFLLGKE